MTLIISWVLSWVWSWPLIKSEQVFWIFFTSSSSINVYCLRWGGETMPLNLFFALLDFLFCSFFCFDWFSVFGRTSFETIFAITSQQCLRQIQKMCRESLAMLKRVRWRHWCFRILSLSRTVPTLPHSPPTNCFLVPLIYGWPPPVILTHSLRTASMRPVNSKHVLSSSLLLFFLPLW